MKFFVIFFLFTLNKPDFFNFSPDPSEKTESELLSDAKDKLGGLVNNSGVEISRLQQPPSLLFA